MDWQSVRSMRGGEEIESFLGENEWLIMGKKSC
jgi:hypothetical protein